VFFLRFQYRPFRDYYNSLNSEGFCLRIHQRRAMYKPPKITRRRAIAAPIRAGLMDNPELSTGAPIAVVVFGTVVLGVLAGVGIVVSTEPGVIAGETRRVAASAGAVTCAVWLAAGTAFFTTTAKYEKPGETAS
jgi:hypothetical protein